MNLKKIMTNENKGLKGKNVDRAVNNFSSTEQTTEDLEIIEEITKIDAVYNNNALMKHSVGESSQSQSSTKNQNLTIFSSNEIKGVSSEKEKLEEEINKKDIFDGTYNTISSLASKPIDFAKNYSSNWFLEKLWLVFYLVLFLINLFTFLTQKTWKLFFTLICSLSLLAIKSLFSRISFKYNLMCSLLITVFTFLFFYFLNWLKNLFIYNLKRVIKKFKKKNIDNSKVENDLDEEIEL